MGLKFNPFTGKLDFAGTSGGTPTGAAGGDLSGTYPNPTVDGLQGRPVSNATPYNGQVLQYDGANWVPGSIPSGGSGGGGVVYYLNFNTAADAPITNIPQTPNASKELGITAESTTTSYQSPFLSTASYDFLASFVTDLNSPNSTTIPAGIWDFNTFVESTTTNSANQVFFKIEVLKYDGANAPTLLATSNDTYIYDPTEITQYVTSIVIPQTTILSTDRIVVYLYGRAHQNNNRLTFHFGGNYPSHTHSTMPSVTGTGVVKVVNGVFQSPATTIVNADVSATAAIDQSKISNLTTDLSAKVSKSGDTMTGKLNLPASSTSSANLNLGIGSIPTTPALGDVWLTASTLNAKTGPFTTLQFAAINAANSFNKSQTIESTSATDPALLIKNTGAAESFRVEDESPETTPFIISNTGRVGIGVTPDSTVALKVDSSGIKFSDNTVQTTAAVAGVTSVTGTSPISSSGGSTPAISIADAAADGTTKGAAAFNASDFNSASGVISIDYTNGQSASGSTNGFLTSSDWTTFNNKQATITTGSVDNSVLRADGTGGSTLQNSGIIIDDAIISFSTVTGDATSDVITVTGSAFSNTQPIRFTSLAGGAGLNTTTNYYVREVSGATFKVETSIGGGAINFTTNITAGTLLTGHSVSTNVTLSENTTATNSDLVLTPKGTGALIAGPKPDGTATGGNARGTNSVDLQISRASATQAARGNNGFIGGGVSNEINTGANSAIPGGNANLVTGAESIAAGFQCQAINSRTVAFGNENRATGSSAGAISGQRALADRAGMQAHAIGYFATHGDAQRARFVLRCKTTTNSAVEMALDGSTTYLSIPSGKVIACTINISGVKSDGSAVAHYIRQYAVKNVGGTSSEVYAPVTIGTDNAAGTVIALSANNTDDTLRIAVTGIAAETWRWVASVDAVEIGYGT